MDITGNRSRCLYNKVIHFRVFCVLVVGGAYIFKIQLHRCRYCSSATSCQVGPYLGQARVGSIPTFAHVQPNFFHPILQFIVVFWGFSNISKWLKVLTYFRKVIKRELFPKTNIKKFIGGTTYLMAQGCWNVRRTAASMAAYNKYFGTKILVLSHETANLLSCTGLEHLMCHYYSSDTYPMGF
jgi:hypothetical protein